MTATTDYLTLAELKGALKIPTGTGNDAELVRAIASASRQIDEYCSDQFFLSDAYAKTFRAEWLDELLVGSFATDEDVVVKFDLDDDGVFEFTVPSTDWQADPVDRDPSRPFNTINLLSGTFPGAFRVHPGRNYYAYNNVAYYLGSRRARVQVTAQWGWPEVPPQVVQACQIMSVANFKSKDMTGTTAGTPLASSGAFAARAGYQVSSGGINALAAPLLWGLRNMVVA